MVDIVHMESPAGAIGPTDAVPVSGSNNSEFDILFPPQSTRGDYVLVIGPHISDMAGNEMDQDGDWRKFKSLTSVCTIPTGQSHWKE